MRLLNIFLVLFCWVPAVIKTSSIIQDSGIITAELGHNVTLKCFCQNNAVTFLSWYQQSLGGKPNLIATRMKHHTEADIYPEYKERFQIFAQNEDGINHLIITNVHLSDTGNYYCGILEFNAIEFGQGVFLHVRKSLSDSQAVVHQPAVVPQSSGGSVNLSCTVIADTCAGELSLLWFRYDASQPAVVYPSEGKCTSLAKKDSQVKNCTLNLAIKSARSSDAGTYYCAVASCEEIVFGHGTRLEITGGSTKVSSLLVYSLSVALAVSIVVLLASVSVVYKLKKNLCPVCRGSVSHLTCPAAPYTVQSHDTDNLHYAALSLNRSSERRRQEDNMDTICVYSKINSRKE